jgi:hypothetical protein
VEAPLELAEVRIGEIGEACEFALGEIGDTSLALDEVAERADAQWGSRVSGVVHADQATQRRRTRR